MFTYILDFLGDKARGAIITIAGWVTGKFGVGEIVPKELKIIEAQLPEDLYKLQQWVFIMTLIVAVLTTVSYLYKFFKWVKSHKTQIAGFFKRK